MVEESNGGTNKANVVSKPILKVKIKTTKSISRIIWGQQKKGKKKNQFKGKKGPYFVCG